MAERATSPGPAPVAIVDYGAGNVASVLKALRHVGVDAAITADPEAIRAASRVVFPGQGHFGQAMQRLRSSGLDRVLREVVDRGTPFLGICLGLQLLFEGSDEAPGVAGLGVFRGHCVAFRPPLKVPQIGWNAVHLTRPGTPLDAVAAAGGEGAHFYFVHSYHAVAAEPEVVVATADYGDPFVAAVQRDHVFAAQFHPEKSGAAGLRLLQAWLEGPGRRADLGRSPEAPPC